MLDWASNRPRIALNMPAKHDYTPLHGSGPRHRFNTVARLGTSAIVIVLCCSMLLSGPARAEVQPAQAQGTGGPHAFFPESVFNFGTVTVGATVKHTFTFTNTGDQALEITDVKSTCG